MRNSVLLTIWLTLACLVVNAQPYSGEKLSRGLVGIPTGNGMYLSWRMLLDDAENISFDIYRSTEGGKEKKLNRSSIQKTTDFMDETVDLQKGNRWILKSGKKVLGEWRNEKGNTKPYLSVPIRRPASEMLDGKEYTFSANDCSVGDLDGDGEYEIVVKWMPSITKLPPQKGLSGKTYLDAYKMDGTFLWRIDLGYNIRSGAPTTNFLVFDFDGDGCAELCCKTGDGTVDGVGKVIGDAEADWRTWDKSSPMYGKNSGWSRIYQCL